MAAKPITIVEIDTDACSLVWGSVACGAVLSANAPAKCFNTFATCTKQDKFTRATKTLRFCEARPGFLPADLHFPAVLKVSTFSATANIAGADESLSALGRRATVTVELQDFTYHDRATDPYQAERITGAAQFGGVGYDPASRGTFFARMRARWPYYPGKPLRVIQGFIGDAGELVDAETRHFVLTDISPPDAAGRVKIEAKDVLALADDAKALAPAPSAGALLAAIAVGDATATLTPSGVGASYPTSGQAVIGSELVRFTRVGDVVTFTERGASGTTEAAHSAGDTFQVSLRWANARIDTVISQLLTTYAGVPASYIDTAEWAAEVSRWLPQYKLTRDICAPTGVAKLVGELAQFGISIYPTAAGNKIGLKANRPPDDDPVYSLDEDANLIGVVSDERAEDRLTEVLFYSKQIDPTKSVTDPSNYARCMATFDLDAKGPNKYGDTRLKKVFCPWLNSGQDGVVSAVSLRLLKRFNTPPIRVKARVAWKDHPIEIADVVNLASRVFQDATGADQVRPMQVIGRSDPTPGHEIELTLQDYAFAGRYGYATENARPSYAASSAAERARGMYACNPSTLKMSNGDEPYRAI